MSDREDSPKERLSPRELQAQLRGVYKSIPDKGVVRERRKTYETTSSLADALVNTIMDAFGDPMVHGVTADFPRRQRQIAREAIEQADLTEHDRMLILQDFDLAPALGIDRGKEEQDSDSTFSIVGVTDSHPLDEGIFSSDPVIRGAIEQALYNREGRRRDELRNETKLALYQKNAGQAQAKVALGIEVHEYLVHWEYEFERKYGKKITEKSRDS